MDNVVRQMTWLEQQCSNVISIVTRLRRRLPYLVWRDDEIDVVVTFPAATLPAGLDLHDAMRELYSGPLHEIESQLSRLGIGFDKGVGFGGRDWEWDCSLSGPISVRFRRRSKRPLRRTGISPKAPLKEGGQ